MAYPQRRQVSPDEVLAFRLRRQRLDAERAARLRAVFCDEPLTERAERDLEAWFDRHSLPAGDEEFQYVAHHLQALPAVIRWLRLNSRRKVVAPDLYVTMCSLIESSDGRVNANREQLAQMLGVSVRTVSEIITELEGDDLGVVERKRDGRGVAFFIKPHVATRAPRTAHRKAMAKVKPPPLLSIMQGGKADLDE